jgi:hypothetical protein
LFPQLIILTSLTELPKSYQATFQPGRSVNKIEKEGGKEERVIRKG